MPVLCDWGFEEWKHRALTVPARPRQGGNLHTFVEKGFEFDTGVHYVGGVGQKKQAMRKLLDFVTEGEVGWQQMDDVFDKVVFRSAEQHRGMTVDVREQFDMSSNGGLSGVCAYLKARFPGEEAAIDKYLALCRKASSAARLLFIRNMLPSFLGAILSWFIEPHLGLYYRTTTEVSRAVPHTSQYHSTSTAVRCHNATIIHL